VIVTGSPNFESSSPTLTVPLGPGGTVNVGLELSKFGDPVTITPPEGG